MYCDAATDGTHQDGSQVQGSEADRETEIERAEAGRGGLQLTSEDAEHDG